MRMSEKVCNKHNNNNSDNPLTSRRTDGEKKKFLPCSSTIKHSCLPVWEAVFFTFKSSVSVGGFVPLAIECNGQCYTL